MALFTDGNPNSIGDLSMYETSIVNVASVEGIDLDSKLTLATNELGADILAFLLREWPRDPQSNGSFLFAFNNSEMARRRLGLGTVAVTAPLRQWHILKTLSLVYRDAYDNQLNDRYHGKWQEYAQLAQASSLRYFQDGVGLVLHALPKPGAPVLASVAGALAGTTYFASVTWLNAMGAEGSPSDPLTFDTGSGGLLVVTPPAAPAPPTTAVTGWNVYIGTTASGMTLQNSGPLTLGAPWTIPASGVANGVAIGCGQSPDIYLRDWHEIPRG